MTNLERYILYFCLGVSLASIEKSCSQAHADDINVINSPSDKTKALVIYCNDEEKCAKLLVDKKDLTANYDKIESWLNMILDNPKYLK